MARMQGRVVVLTGATSGIGRATAFGLARMGAHLALVCRDRGRGEETVAAVAAASSTRADLFVADLAVQGDVHRVAGELLARYPAIHVLVNNAGIVNLRYRETVDGVEEVFAVNHLAPFLLTHLLLDRLKASAPARIVNVASHAHKFGPMHFDDIGWKQGYKGMRVYGQSKLANVLFTRELAARLAGTGVTVNCLHPGAVATRLGQNNGRISILLTKALAPFFRTAEQGAATSIHLAASPDVDGVSGRYFSNRREARPSRAAQDPVAARRLWDLSVALTGVGA
jgi:NAD(P)-dependent dehydrogenase (short-subunit alcohol dehydrogenase family)